MASRHGKGLTMTEAFFEESDDPKLAGFGVSPDGRLWDDEGKSKGLLELKYLSSGSMAGAVKKYTPQVQMQMAVTGETQTNFFALDKYTGEYVHEVIKADPAMQKELITAGTQALELGASLDYRGIQALEKKKKFKKNQPRKQVGVSEEEVVGQQTSIDLSEEVEQPMTAFQYDALAMAQTPASGGIAAQTELAKRMQKQEQADKMKNAIGNAKDADVDGIRKLGLLEVAAYKEDADRTEKKAKDFIRSQEAVQKAGLVEGAAYKEDATRVANAQADIQKAGLLEGAAYKEDATRVANAQADIQKAGLVEGAAYKEAATRASDIQAGIQKAGITEGAAYKEDASRTEKADADTRKLALTEIAAYKEQEDRVKAATKANADGEASERKLALTEISAYAEDQKRTDNAAEAADKETAQAAKEASSNLREFGNAVKKAGSVLGELAGLVQSGNQSGMDEVRLAAESGLDVTQVRGMREAMEMGGMNASGINKVVGQAGSLVTTFNDEASAASKFTDIMSARGRSNLEAVRTMDMPSIQELQGMDAQQLTTKVASMMQGQTPEAKTQIGQMFGMTSLATSDISPEMINALDSTINESGLRTTSQGIKTVEQQVREVKEGVGSLGDTAGSISSGVSTGVAVAGSATVGFAASKAAQLMNMAKPNSMGAKAIKNLSTAAKATPLALAVSVAPMAVRHVADIKDDGSVGDSLMDVAEMAAYGAAAGSVIPMVGTAVGAGIGFAAGVANEAWEYFSADDAVPSANIGNMPMQGKEATQPDKNNINVEVTNEISPDLIRTTTNVDGDLNVDEESGLGTGG